MPDTFTPNYNLTRPEINGSRDTWGNKHNDNFTKVDTALKGLADSVALKLSAASDKSVTAVGFVDGDKTKPFMRNKLPNAAANTAVDVLLATQEQLVPNIPKGVITAWYGVISNIPAGWTLCDGTKETPDLRGKFILGAGQSGATPAFPQPGGVGGTATHGHSASISATALTIAQMPAHAHGVNDPSHGHSGGTDYVGDHTHPISSRKGSGGGGYAGYGGNYVNWAYSEIVTDPNPTARLP